MNAEILKTEILKLYRFKRQYYICATEVNTGIEIADILCMDDKEIIEIEIKITWKDFLADFRKSKHLAIKPHLKYIYLKANRFYFCVPSEIDEKCMNYLKDKNYEYGLIVYTTEQAYNRGKLIFNGKLTQIKRCKRLKELDTYEREKIKKWIIQRATSELVNLRDEKYKLDNTGVMC